MRIAKRLSICLQAKNARAILKRLSSPEPETGAEEEVAWDHETGWADLREDKMINPAPGFLACFRPLGA